MKKLEPLPNSLKRRRENASSMSHLSSSDSESDSDSDSDSSNSDSSSPPSQVLSKSTCTTHVPPGYGKSSTHSRNLRRRLKRAHDRSQRNTLATFSASNGTPIRITTSLSQPPPDVEPHLEPLNLIVHNETTAIEESQLMMLSLRQKNKNKKKNIRTPFSSPLPPKIVFENSSTSSAPHPTPPSVCPRPQSHSRLVVPSERQDAGTLPPRMFISSASVKEKPKYGSKHKESMHKYKYAAYNEEPSANIWVDSESFYADAASDAPSYEAVERAWSTYPRIMVPEQLSEVGRIVGWWVSVSPLRSC